MAAAAGAGAIILQETFVALDLRQKLWVAPALNAVDGDDWHHAKSQERWALNLELPTRLQKRLAQPSLDLPRVRAYHHICDFLS
ncbi:MAG: hypothetical protein ABSA90_19500 [Xanthobacteraceae bacterium]|jgi:hypothetical protein